ncbi:ABC transporter substrate-binding protein [Undibacter mobilis]|uniref:Branched-chain amino acid ABC transporter substrate-binding protein n=1 Tax=Undibacter mobilis TaxID=2292256 RepID=A0A371BA53_9BRAD|nr:ABC transporter substrate-binding protein [Undibacter mobilis]RDV04283.1 branched-chain amino acid ABC transporter substrate-binding protein [Undibacter mobilis]
MRKHTRLVFAACLSVIATAAAAFEARAEIVVGGTFSLTGPAAALGTSFQRTMPLLPKEIAGEPVRYVIVDDGSDPSNAVRNVRKLINEDRVDVLIGPTNAATGYAVAPLLAEFKVPLISGTAIDLFGEKSYWFINVSTPISMWVDRIAKRMKETGMKRVAYVGYNDVYGDTAFANFKKSCDQLGIEIISNERFARADTSFVGQALRIVAAQPDAVFIAASGSPAVLPNVALRDRGYTKPLYNAPVAVGQDFLRLGGAKVEGIIAASNLIPVPYQIPDSNPSKKAVVELADQFAKLYPTTAPDTQNPTAYDSGIVLKMVAAEALKVAKPGTEGFRLAIRDRLHTIRGLVGSIGVYNFEPNEPYGVGSNSVVFVTVQDGKWKYIGD